MPMRFPYLNAARVKLQERMNACLRCDYNAAERYTAHFLLTINSDPILRTIAAEISAVKQSKIGNIERFLNRDYRRLDLPRSQDECVALYLGLLERLADPDPEMEIPDLDFVFGRGSVRHQDIMDSFFQQVLAPFCSYLDERIVNGDLLLYMLCRYQRECAWFEQDELFELAGSANSRKLEEELDAHLRAWLFREGVDYPFSTPRSPSGRADIVVWDGEEPLPVEVKVFDGADRDSGHIKQGLWQAYRYGSDYAKSFGYLVVFNTSSDLLLFEGSIASNGPPCIPVADKHVLVVTVNVAPTLVTASKEKPGKVHRVEMPTK